MSTCRFRLLPSAGAAGSRSSRAWISDSGAVGGLLGRATDARARQWQARIRGERGKPPKVAVTAVMRKLAVLVKAMLEQDQLWTPEPVRGYAGRHAP